MYIQYPRPRRRIKTTVLCLSALILFVIFGKAVIQSSLLILGALVLSFLCIPIARWYEKKLPRSVSAFLSLVTLIGAVFGIVWMILPLMIREIRVLLRLLPESIGIVSGFFEKIAAWIHHHFNGMAISGSMPTTAGSTLSDIASGTIAFAGSVADIISRASLTVVLCFFFLNDRDHLLLRLELTIPAKHRAMAVRMGNAVIREMRMYLRGQATVAAGVALLSTIGLYLLRIRSALALGPIIGIMNMIPYFGPFIGGIPAVLIALADSWQKAGLTVILLILIQQLDNNIISPRVMGSVTGFPPALVLIAIFAGSRIAGIAGMLFALPLIMTFRTLFRVFVQRHENI